MLQKTQLLCQPSGLSSGAYASGGRARRSGGTQPTLPPNFQSLLDLSFFRFKLSRSVAAPSSSDPWIPLLEGPGDTPVRPLSPGRLRRRFLQPCPEERSHAPNFQCGRRRIKEIYMGLARRGGKRRRLPTGDSQPEIPVILAKQQYCQCPSRSLRPRRTRPLGSNAGGGHA